MDSIVEVETAGITTKGMTAMVVALVNAALVVFPTYVVSTSTVVPSIGGCSLSAVAPDHSNRKELALAGA